MKFVRKGSNGNKSTMAQIMSRYQTGDKPLSETMFSDVSCPLSVKRFNHPVLENYKYWSFYDHGFYPLAFQAEGVLSLPASQI